MDALHGRKRRNVPLFFMGCVVGGGVFGFVLALIAGLAGVLPSLARMVFASCLILASVTTDVSGKQILPRIRRQIRQSLRDTPADFVPLLLGTELGLAFRTETTSLALYFAPAVALVLSPVSAVTLGIVFGFTRGLSATNRSIARGLADWEHSFDSHASGVRKVSVVVGAACALLLVVAPAK